MGEDLNEKNINISLRFNLYTGQCKDGHGTLKLPKDLRCFMDNLFLFPNRGGPLKFAGQD